MATELAQPLTLSDKIADFLAQRRIAVAGISAARETPGNMIYRKLKAAGYQVFAISPSTEAFDGDRCYADLLGIPESVDGVVIATRPALTVEIGDTEGLALKNFFRDYAKGLDAARILGARFTVDLPLAG